MRRGARPDRRRNVVCLVGRLGNQLFGYSFARWLEEVTGLPSAFDLSLLRRVGIQGSAPLRHEIQRRAVAGSAIFPAPGGRLGGSGAAFRRVLGPPRVVADMSSAGPDLVAEQAPAWWVGYWQQLRYAASAREELRGLMGIPPRQPGSAPVQVAVHVRRGDYVELGRARPSHWYARALDAALAGVGDGALITVYSDDAPWCRHALDLGQPFRVSSGGSPLADFRGMAGADVLIASESTFSWWAGYLGTGRVVLPGGPGGTAEYPCEWELVD